MAPGSDAGKRSTLAGGQAFCAGAIIAKHAFGEGLALGAEVPDCSVSNLI